MRRFSLVSFILLVGYAYVISWFYATDMYQQHFFDHGALVISYHLARFALMLYLFWLIYWAGWTALLLAAGRPALTVLPTGERYALCFFTGAACWHILLLPFGLAGNFTYIFAVTITTVAMLLSLPHLAGCLREAADGLKQFGRPALTSIHWAAIVLGISAMVFVIVKIIYPTGWHDYFVHYAPFYNTVVERSSTAPNASWYHFFYSKGAGLYFIAMLLSDPLAPSLVAGSFVLMAALVVFLLVKRVAGGLWPWMAALLYLVLQLYIRGFGLGSWGHLPKLHELTAAMTLALLLCVIMLRDATDKRLWITGMLLIVIGAVIITPAMALLYAAFLGVAGGTWWLQGNRREAWMLAAGIVAAMGTMLGIFMINFAMTGIPDDHFILPLWTHFNLQKIQAWGTLFELVMSHHNLEVMASLKVGLTLDDVRKLLMRFLRFDLLYILYAFAAAIAIGRFARREKSPGVPNRDWVCYLALVFACAAFGLTAGRTEPVSFYRFSSFIFGPMLCLAIFCIAWAGGTRGRIWVPVAVSIVCVVVSWSRYKADDLTATFSNAGKFISGNYSIDDAYSHQRGLPADAFAEGAIHPAARAAWQIAGRKVRIWTFTPYTYCMLPGCRMESSLSRRLSPHADRILFGPAAEAKKILQREGLNYFLISPQMEIRDPLPVSDLFSPDHIGKYLAVRWTDGNNVLLTWPGPETKPISKQWLKRYREKVATSETIVTLPKDKMREYFAGFKDYKGDTLPPLPW